MSRNGIDVRLARRWFWTLPTTAASAMGVLYQALTADPGAGTAVAVPLSGVVLIAVTAQAARIRFAVSGHP